MSCHAWILMLRDTPDGDQWAPAGCFTREPSWLDCARVFAVMATEMPWSAYEEPVTYADYLAEDYDRPRSLLRSSSYWDLPFTGLAAWWSVEQVPMAGAS